MRKGVWGPIIWKFLHMISIKLKESEFNKNKEIIIDLILSICNNLPCPACSSHARGYLKKHNFKHINTKENMIKILWSMHNDVNVRIKKQKIEYDDMLKIYENEKIEPCAITFFQSFSRMNYGERMMLYSFQRKKFIEKYLPLVKDNIKIWFY